MSAVLCLESRLARRQAGLRGAAGDALTEGAGRGWQGLACLARDTQGLYNPAEKRRTGARACVPLRCPTRAFGRLAPN
ncbi:hypothetical protein AAFF_G00304370 [Aldrovandia affinis]|uniref:Uncharacterized protein n=1 Tax=Aldrovandia affinis TaxID=143900 RepID=A0AAD7SR37_9TELE|nr:hypothetical protein AAFF_G00304370 [Aldrovandia affinis]